MSSPYFVPRLQVLVALLAIGLIVQALNRPTVEMSATESLTEAATQDISSRASSLSLSLTLSWSSLDTPSGLLE